MKIAAANPLWGAPRIHGDVRVIPNRLRASMD
jgi:hypothetical protein